MAAIQDFNVAVAQPSRAGVFERWAEFRARFLHEAESWFAIRPTSPVHHERMAQATCARAVEAFWDRRTDHDRRWLNPWEPERIAVPLSIRGLAREGAELLDAASLGEAAFLLGALYTALLPREIRQRRGAYYTPPALAQRLLDLAAGSGADLSAATALDPACGGGAFLTPLAGRLLAEPSIQAMPPRARVELLERRLAGVELDEFAAWMTRTFLQILTHPICTAAGRPLQVSIQCGDALSLAPRDHRRFDLIVGNPPYGRVSLDAEQRAEYERSLYGHANLYGVFLDAALRWRSPTGVIAFVTPTSLLGGRYFSRLRNLLLLEAPPLAIDVLEARTGIFELVQQEACLAVFGPNPKRRTTVHLLAVTERTVEARRAGTFAVETRRNAPWLLPRTPLQAALARRARTMDTRLHDLGYRASTGPLVWNRHKTSLRNSVRPNAYPLIWAEAVKPNRFNFAYRSRAHAPFCDVRDGEEHLLDGGPCVLVQRTTSKEQARRLIACAVPGEFLRRWRRIVVENHVNVLRAIGNRPVAPNALAAVLNTGTVDQVFRCLSGTVAVSASELHALPLPPRAVFTEVEELLEDAEDKPVVSAAIGERIEEIVGDAYRMEAI